MDKYAKYHAPFDHVPGHTTYPYRDDSVEYPDVKKNSNTSKYTKKANTVQFTYFVHLKSCTSVLDLVCFA
ncbi:hypothetical protein GN958_ATG05848 [Phytophthora infestans]|uniref:Uncharacterized protein n=1 Tax=Phytophthora infestans TaxID=4787 RepID=A0A8S9V111_PHYIN|nr:hypothetical protein GN958_ATG05848 [Phytophthora infestans]